MTSRSNPFKPGFGNSPAVLAGRDDIVELLAESLDNGPGALGRATLYTGARGTGKTVMLNEAADVARRRGWLVIEETASRGFVRRLVAEHLPALLAEIDPKAHRVRLTGATAPLGWGRLDWQSSDAHEVSAGLRNQLELACTLLAADRHRPARDGRRGAPPPGPRAARLLRRRAAPVPQRPRDRRRRRRPAVGGQQPAQRPTCSRSCDAPTATCSAASVWARSPGRSPPRSRVAAGRSPPDVAELAAEATGGYPFLIQLVGYSVWRQHPDAADVTIDDVEVGAPRRCGGWAAWCTSRPSPTCPMSTGRSSRRWRSITGPRGSADLAERLGVDQGYVSVYRRRLIDALLIEPAGRGSVRFTLPYLAEHLRAHADSAPALPRKAS